MSNSRLTISLPDNVYEMLEELSIIDGSKTNVLRKSISLYYYIHKEAISKKLPVKIINESEGETKELVLY